MSLTEKEKKKSVPVSQKSPRALHVLNHGWWQLAVGGWRRLAVGSWQLAVDGGWWLTVGGWRHLAVVGSWRLVAAGGWRRLVAGGWWRLVVGGWWRLAVDGSWRLAVGGPLGRSLRAVLSKNNKKKISSLKDAPALRRCPEWGKKNLVVKLFPEAVYPCIRRKRDTCVQWLALSRTRATDCRRHFGSRHHQYAC